VLVLWVLVLALADAMTDQAVLDRVLAATQTLESACGPR
jgi:hypothetical protein